MRRSVVVFSLLALLAGGCADDAVTSTTGPPTTLDSGGILEQVAALVDDAERVRGLEFFDDPVVAIVSQQELADRVAAQIEEELDPEELDVFQRLYELLGLLDGSVDLGQAYIDLYAEQVGGFYDPDTGEMVISGASSISPLSKTIVVHELVHALTDEHYGFGAVTDDLVDADRFEEAIAIQALVEGDATYYQLVYMQELPIDEQVEAIQESLDTDTTVLDSLPGWFGEDLTFPYDSGFAFVSRLIDRQGAVAVNQAYERFPETTEQILHPDKYFAQEPALEVEMPAVDLPGYSEFEESVFGEWNTMLYLLGGIDRGDATVGASGWGGDRYRVYWNGSDVAFALVFEGDTPRDAEEFAGYLADSIGSQMGLGSPRTTDGITSFSGGDRFARVELSDRRVLFVAAFDTAIGQALFDGLRDGGVLQAAA